MLQNNYRLQSILQNALNLLTTFEETYNESINLLIFRIRSLKPIEWVNVYNNLELIADLRKLQGDLNRRFKKYVIRFTKQIDVLRRNRYVRSVTSVSQSIQKLQTFQENLRKGILEVNYKSQVEAFAKIVAALFTNEESDDTLTSVARRMTSAKDDDKVMTPKEIVELNKLIQNRNESLKRTVSQDSSSSEESSDIDAYEEDNNPFAGSGRSGDDEEMSELSFNTSNVNLPEVNLLRSYMRIEEAIERLHEKVDSEIEHGRSMEEQLNSLSLTLTNMLVNRRQQSTVYVEGEDMDDLTTEEERMQTKINDIKNKVMNIELKIDNLTHVAHNRGIEDIDALKTVVKNEVTEHMKKIIQKYDELLKQMETQNTNILNTTQQITSIVAANLVNYDNIVKIITRSLDTHSAEGIKQIKNVVTIISNEFRNYIESLEQQNVKDFNATSRLLKEYEARFQNYKKEFNELIDIKNNISDFYNKSVAAFDTFRKEFNDKIEANTEALKSLYANITQQNINVETLTQLNMDSNVKMETFKNMFLNINAMIQNNAKEMKQILEEKELAIKNINASHLTAMNSIHIQNNEALATVHEQYKAAVSQLHEENKQVINAIKTEIDTEIKDQQELVTSFKTELKEITETLNAEINKHSDQQDKLQFSLETFVNRGFKETLSQTTKEQMSGVYDKMKKLYDEFEKKQFKESKGLLERHKATLANINGKLKRQEDRDKALNATINTEIDNIKKVLVVYGETLEDTKKETMAETKQNVEELISKTYADIQQKITEFIDGDENSLKSINNLLKKITALPEVTAETSRLVKEEKEKLANINTSISTLTSNTDSEMREIVSELRNIRDMIDEVKPQSKKRKIARRSEDDQE